MFRTYETVRKTSTTNSKGRVEVESGSVQTTISPGVYFLHGGDHQDPGSPDVYQTAYTRRLT